MVAIKTNISESIKTNLFNYRNQKAFKFNKLNRFLANLNFYLFVFLLFNYPFFTFAHSVSPSDKDPEQCLFGDWLMDTTIIVDQINQLLSISAPETTSDTGLKFESAEGMMGLSFIGQDNQQKYSACSNLTLNSSFTSGAPVETSLNITGKINGALTLQEDKLKPNPSGDRFNYKASMKIGNTKMPLPSTFPVDFELIRPNSQFSCNGNKLEIISKSPNSPIPITHKYIREKGGFFSGCESDPCAGSRSPFNFYIKGSCTFVERVNQKLNEIITYPMGRSLVQQFSGSNTIDIEGSTTIPCAAKSTDEILLRHDMNDCPTTHCAPARPITAAIIHELVHLWAGRNGMNESDEDIAVGLGRYEYQSDGSNPNQLNYSENRFLHKLGLPLRRCYN